MSMKKSKLTHEYNIGFTELVVCQVRHSMTSSPLCRSMPSHINDSLLLSHVVHLEILSLVVGFEDTYAFIRLHRATNQKTEIQHIQLLIGICSYLFL